MPNENQISTQPPRDEFDKELIRGRWGCQPTTNQQKTCPDRALVKKTKETQRPGNEPNRLEPPVAAHLEVQHLPEYLLSHLRKTIQTILSQETGMSHRQ